MPNFKLIGIHILFLFFLQISPSKIFAATQELPMVFSYTTEAGVHNWTRYLYTPAKKLPPTFNYVGLRGNFTLSSNTASDGIFLLYIRNNPDNKCPPNGIVPESFQWQAPGSNKMVAAYVLKINKVGTETLNIDFTLPLKKKMQGCLFINVHGGDPQTANPIIMSGDIKVLYDADSPASPQPEFMTSLGGEWCTQRKDGEGCTDRVENILPTTPFALKVSTGASKRLLAISGNIATAANRIGNKPSPLGNWTSSTDYYIYHGSSCLPLGRFKPALSFAKIPNDATLLFKAPISGNKLVGKMFKVSKVFDPPIALKESDCLVTLQWFNEPSGALAAESQLIAHTSPYLGGDLNTNAIVDTQDVNAFRVDFGKNSTSPALPADIDQNHKVDIYDYSYLVADFGR